MGKSDTHNMYASFTDPNMPHVHFPRAVPVHGSLPRRPNRVGRTLLLSRKKAPDTIHSTMADWCAGLPPSFSLRNQVVSSLVWLWWIIDLARFEFESGIVLFYFSLTFVSFGESRSLVSWCAGGRCNMACSDEDCGRSRRPGAEDRGWLHRSDTRWPSGRQVGWRRVRSTPGTWRLGARVSWLSLKTKVDGLWMV
jgi:hypothetical protein